MQQILEQPIKNPAQNVRHAYLTGRVESHPASNYLLFENVVKDGYGAVRDWLHRNHPKYSAVEAIAFTLGVAKTRHALKVIPEEYYNHKLLESML